MIDLVEKDTGTINLRTTAARIIDAFGAFYFDDFCAHLAEKMCTQRAREQTGKVDDFDSCEHDENLSCAALKCRRNVVE